MITLLSKVKTLIEYGKFGMFICEHYKNKPCELFFPRGFPSYINDNNGGYQKTATRIGGYVWEIGGRNFLQYNKTVTEINLPECTSLGSFNWTGVKVYNTTLKRCVLPKLSVLSLRLLYFSGLEYLEVGQLETFDSQALVGCTGLKELYFKEGTRANIYVYMCEELTQKSLHSMIECLEDRTNKISLTFHCGGFNFTKIDDEHIAMLEDKNIEYK